MGERAPGRFAGRVAFYVPPLKVGAELKRASLSERVRFLAGGNGTANSTGTREVRQFAPRGREEPGDMIKRKAGGKREKKRQAGNCAPCGGAGPASENPKKALWFCPSKGRRD